MLYLSRCVLYTYYVTNSKMLLIATIFSFTRSNKLSSPIKLYYLLFFPEITNHFVLTIQSGRFHEYASFSSYTYRQRAFSHSCAINWAKRFPRTLHHESKYTVEMKTWHYVFVCFRFTTTKYISIRYKLIVFQATIVI